MATLTITNPGSSDVYCSDLYVSVPAGKSVSTTRAASDISRMSALQTLVAAGSLTVAVAYSADEKNSGMVLADQTAASTTGGLGDVETLRFPLTAGGGGSADDVTLYALGALPYKKFRILDAYGFISAGNSAGRTIQIRTAAAGAGTLCAEVSAAAAGRGAQTTTVTASQVVTSSGTVGLFARRSDSAIAGEVVVTIRIEK